MKRVYRVTAFRTHWDSPSLMGALIIVAGFRLDYGQSVRIGLTSFMEER